MLSIPSLFLSYSRRDLSVAEELVDRLEPEGLKLWMDRHDIEPTQEWLDALYAAIDDSRGCVVLLSRASLSSKYCRLELNYALKQGKRIIPILLEEVDLEQVPSGLRSIHWIGYREVIEAPSVLRPALERDREFQDQLGALQRALRLWRRGGESRDLLLAGDELNAAENWASRAARDHRGISPDLRGFIQSSRRAADMDVHRRRVWTQGLLIVSSLGLVAALALAVFGSTKSMRNSRALMAAEQRSERSEELIDFLMTEFLPKLGVYDDNDIAYPLSKAAIQYYAYVDPEEWTFEERKAYSRMGHLYMEIACLNRDFEGTDDIFDGVLENDLELVNQSPDDLDLQWNLAFTYFWIGERASLVGNADLQWEGHYEFYEIAKRYKSVSNDWEYEYLNGIYNLILYSRDYGRLDNFERYLGELFAYIEVKSGVVDQNADYWLDLSALCGKMLLPVGEYERYFLIRDRLVDSIDLDHYVSHVDLQDLSYALRFIQGEIYASRALGLGIINDAHVSTVSLLKKRVSGVGVTHAWFRHDLSYLRESQSLLGELEAVDLYSLSDLKKFDDDRFLSEVIVVLNSLEVNESYGVLTPLVPRMIDYFDNHVRLGSSAYLTRDTVARIWFFDWAEHKAQNELGAARQLLGEAERFKATYPEHLTFDSSYMLVYMQRIMGLEPDADALAFIEGKEIANRYLEWRCDRILNSAIARHAEVPE